MDNFSKCLAIGFSIAAPVGPIGLLCIRRSMIEGRLAGFSAGVGAATADALYGLVAASGFSVLASTLLEYRIAIQVAGGLFLLVLGLKILCGKSPAPVVVTESTRPREGRAPSHALVEAYASTFLLTLSNPATILSFVGIFAGMQLNPQGPWSTRLAVAGIFCGSSAWWLMLSTGASWFAGWAKPRSLHWINVVAGAFLAGSALWQLGRLALVVMPFAP